MNHGGVLGDLLLDAGYAERLREKEAQGVTNGGDRKEASKLVDKCQHREANIYASGGEADHVLHFYPDRGCPASSNPGMDIRRHASPCIATCHFSLHTAYLRDQDVCLSIDNG